MKILDLKVTYDLLKLVLLKRVHVRSLYFWVWACHSPYSPITHSHVTHKCSLSLSLSHTQTNYGVLVLTFFLWGHAEVVLGFFLSNFFSRPRTATIIGYLLVISGIVVALILEGLQVGVAHWSCDLIMQSYIVYHSCIDTYTYMVHVHALSHLEKLMLPSSLVYSIWTMHTHVYILTHPHNM